MNAFFELLHGTHTAFAVFVVDVAVFVAVALSIYAIAFLAKCKIGALLNKRAPRYFKKGKSKKTS